MEAVLDRPRYQRVSWGGLFAGFFTGVGTLFLLLSLGAAVGFTAVDPRNYDTWRNAGIGLGIWGGVSAIIAAFFSAWVASRLAGFVDRTAGVLHGVALWGLTWAVTLWLGAMLVSGVAGAAAQSPAARGNVGTLQNQAQQLAPSAQQAAQGGTASAWGLFIISVFTLAASAVGGAAGARLAKAEHEHDERVPTRPLTPQPQRP